MENNNVCLYKNRVEGPGWPFWLLVAALWALAMAVAGADNGPIRLDQFGLRTEPVDLTCYQQVCYVHQDREEADLGGTGTQLRPWNSVMHAVEMIADAGPGKRTAVLVARGEYAVRGMALKPYVDLYGGFDPENWTRDIQRNITTLDGGGVAQILIGADNAVLDGFTIIHGRSDGPGGAIVCRRAAPRITNNIISVSDTRAPGAGGLGQTGAGVAGGGIACLDGAAPEIARNIIAYCTTGAGPGGGIVCDGGSAPRISGNLIMGNITGLNTPASGAGAQLRLSAGGGIACLGGSSPRILNNVIADNVAGGKSDGGGIYCAAGAAPVIEGNIITGNLSSRGGAVAAMAQADPQLRGNYVASNDAAEAGGGLYLENQGSGWMVNNIIVCNNAQLGGGVASHDAVVRLMNNTICDNSASQGGAVHCVVTGRTGRPPEIVNSIFWGNRGLPTIYHHGGDLRPSVSYCDVQGGHEGNGNFVADPQFAITGFENQVSAVALNPARSQMQLTVETDRKLSLPELPGRLIRVGNKRSMIGAVRRAQFTVWGDLHGDLDRGGLSYGVMPTYELLTGSPCLAAGTAKGAPPIDLYGHRRPGTAKGKGKVDLGAIGHTWAAVQATIRINK